MSNAVPDEHTEAKLAHLASLLADAVVRHRALVRAWSGAVDDTGEGYTAVNLAERCVEEAAERYEEAKHTAAALAGMPPRRLAFAK